MEGEITIRELVDEALEGLRRAGYSERGIDKHFAMLYRRLIRFADGLGQDRLTEELAEAFLEDAGENFAPRNFDRTKRALRLLCDLAGIETDAFDPPAPDHFKLTYEVPEKLAEGYAALVERGAAEGLQPGTIAREDTAAKRFLCFLARRIDDLSELSLEDVDAYVRDLVETVKPTTVAREVGIARKMVECLVEAGTVDPDVLRLFPVLPRRPQPELGRCLSEEELSFMLKAAAESGYRPKRSLAVVAVMVLYMLRATDVVEMELGDIRWREGTVVVRARKTKQERVFPLPDDLRYILLDYIKNERPECGSSRLFVGTRYPHAQLKGYGSIDALVKKAARDAGIARPDEVSSHTLRRSGATILMNGGVDYNVISEMLIHVMSGTYCTGTTMRYIDVHTERLRSAAMEVKPHA